MDTDFINQKVQSQIGDVLDAIQNADIATAKDLLTDLGYEIIKLHSISIMCDRKTLLINAKKIPQLIKVMGFIFYAVFKLRLSVDTVKINDGRLKYAVTLRTS